MGTSIAGFLAPGQPNTVPATAADQYLYSTAAGVWALATVTAGGRAILNLSWSAGTQVPSLTAAGTAAMLTVGVAASNLIQLDSGAKLPAVDGSQLINLPAAMGTGRTFYYNYTDASDIGGAYKIAQTTPSTNGQSSLSQANTGTGWNLVGTFATPIGVPNVTSVPAGISDRYFWANVDNGVAKFQLETYKRTHPGGAETLLRTNESQSFSNTTAAPMEWSGIDTASHAIDLTDRLVYKLYTARVSGPSTVTVSVYFEGTTRFSHSHSTIAEPTPALTALAVVGPPTVADQYLYSTAATTWTLGTVTAAGRALMDDATAADQRTTLGLGTAATSASTAFQAADATLTAVAAWSWTSGVEVKTLTAADTFGTLVVGTAANNLVQLDGSAKLPAVDGSQLTGLSAGAGDATKKTFTQNSHTLVVGNVVRHNGTIWVVAQADSAANAEVFGIVDAKDTNTLSVTFSGYISGLSGLTAGAGHFLSPSSAGALTSTDPTTSGQVSKPVLVAITTTTGIVQIQRGYVIP